MIRILVVLAALVCAAPAVAQPLPENLDKENALVLDTSKGRIVIKLRPDVAPKAAARLKLLAREGFYNNVPFHRVIPRYFAQTGDREKQDGSGVSKYPNLTAEFSKVPIKRGIVAMARTNEPDSANSQFLIMAADAPTLNGQYTVVGEVVLGIEVVDRIKPGARDAGYYVTDPDMMLKAQVGADIK